MCCFFTYTGGEMPIFKWVTVRDSYFHVMQNSAVLTKLLLQTICRVYIFISLQITKLYHKLHVNLQSLWLPIDDWHILLWKIWKSVSINTIRAPHVKCWHISAACIHKLSIKMLRQWWSLARQTLSVIIVWHSLSPHSLTQTSDKVGYNDTAIINTD